MLDALLSPTVIAGVVLVLLVLIALTVLLRRRRAAQDAVLPPPELSQQVDYTSIPYEEPKTPIERLRSAPLGVKLLLGLVPLVLIVAGFVLWQTFAAPPSTAEQLPTPEPPKEIANVTATLASPTRIVIDASTNLPDGAQVAAALRQGEADLAWFTPDSALGQVSGGQVQIVLVRAKDAPAPTRASELTVVLRGVGDNLAVEAQPAKLTIPPIYAKDFFGEQAAAAPTAPATPVPAPAPTSPPATPAPAEPTPAPAAELQATVFNGGNIRRVPRVTSDPKDVLGQLHAGEVVALLERSADGDWYRVKAPEAEGWVSVTLLTVDEQMAAQVPVAGQAPAQKLMATVFNGGNVRERPIDGDVLDQVNAGEAVTLLEKTADGKWYRIINLRSVSGWVSVTLLTIDEQVAAQVPVAK